MCHQVGALLMKIRGSPSVVSASAAAASPRDVLEMQFPGPAPDLLNQKLLVSKKPQGGVRITRKTVKMGIVEFHTRCPI